MEKNRDILPYRFIVPPLMCSVINDMFFFSIKYHPKNFDIYAQGKFKMNFNAQTMLIIEDVNSGHCIYE